MILRCIALVLILLTCSTLVTAQNRVELYAMIGSDYMASPGDIWQPEWKSLLSGGATVAINDRFAVEGYLGKRGEFHGSYVHYNTQSTLTQLTGSLVVNLKNDTQHRPYAYGGLGLLHHKQSDIIFRGPLPDDDDRASYAYSRLGITMGVGTKAFFNRHVGIRPEFRYTFDVNDDLPRPDVGTKFMTFSIGIVVAP